MKEALIELILSHEFQYDGIYFMRGGRFSDESIESLAEAIITNFATGKLWAEHQEEKIINKWDSGISVKPHEDHPWVELPVEKHVVKIPNDCLQITAIGIDTGMKDEQGNVIPSYLSNEAFFIRVDEVYMRSDLSCDKILMKYVPVTV